MTVTHDLHFNPSSNDASTPPAEGARLGGKQHQLTTSSQEMIVLHPALKCAKIIPANAKTEAASNCLMLHSSPCPRKMLTEGFQKLQKTLAIIAYSLGKLVLDYF